MPTYRALERDLYDLGAGREAPERLQTKPPRLPPRRFLVFPGTQAEGTRQIK